MKPILATGFSMIVLLSGCANLTSPAREHALDPSKQYWFDYDATRRGAILIQDSQKIKICAEPSPDTALNLVSKLEASLENKEVGKTNGSAEFSSSAISLAERTQMVMFLREALYRLCEQSLNQQLTPEQVLSAYIKVIEAAQVIAEADRQKAMAAAAKAVHSLTPEQLKAFQFGH